MPPETSPDLATELADQRVMAAKIGVRVTVSLLDRVTDAMPATTVREVLWRDPRGSLACPTCEDGMRTIASPQRCRQCVLAGL